MSHGSGTLRVALGVASALVLSLVGVAPADAAPDTKKVSYAGVSVDVPIDWPVIELERDSTTCVRTDREAVYVGPTPEVQDCPARLLGRADTVWLRPGTGTQQKAQRRSAGPQIERRAAAATATVKVDEQNVRIDASWTGDSSTVDDVLDSVKVDAASPDAPATPQARGGAADPQAQTPTAGTGDVALDPTRTSTAAPALLRSTTDTRATTAALAAAPSPTTRPYVGMGMDTCAAPSLSTMRAWNASPYRAIGIYIGGSMRACPDGNLNASWLQQVNSMGWATLPIYVGLQAPCVVQGNLAKIDPARAATQGTAAGSDAVAMARKFGIATGQPLYYDMEHYTGDTTCKNAVLDFLSAYTKTVQSQGYRSGVYGNTPSLMRDLSVAKKTGRAGFVAPDQVWYAQWDGKQTLDGSTAVPEFSADLWNDRTRTKQYRGPFNDTWGGVTINIDANYSDSYLQGNGVNPSYGTNTYGPGSAQFVFTGPSSYFQPMPGVGVKGMAYHTGATSASSEVNGATWRIGGLAAGGWNTQVFVPNRNASMKARYTVTHSGGTSSVVVDQATKAGQWVTLGSYQPKSGTITVHVGDKDAGGSTTTRLGLDAVRVTPVAKPGAPTSVQATPGEGLVKLRWGAASGIVSGYQVRDIVTGEIKNVTAAARTATFAGQRPNLVHKYTVTARNATGTGPSATSKPVVPQLPGSERPLNPYKLLDTRNGSGLNTRSAALPPGEMVRIKLVGQTGSSAPVGTTAARVNVMTPATAAAGALEFWGPEPGAPVRYQVSLRRTSDAAVSVPVNSRGVITMRNTTAAPLDVALVVQGVTVAEERRWTATDPVRLGNTLSGAAGNSSATPVAAGGTRTFQIAGLGGVPTSAVSVQATVTAIKRGGWGRLMIGSRDAQVVTYGDTSYTTNTVTARLTSAGRLTIRNVASRPVDLLVDVRGYSVAGASNVVPTGAAPVFDGAIAPGASAKVRANAIPRDGAASAKAVLVHVTARPGAGGGVTVRSTPGGAYALTVPANAARTGTVPVPLASDGTITLTNKRSSTGVYRVEVVGYLK